MRERFENTQQQSNSGNEKGIQTVEAALGDITEEGHHTKTTNPQESLVH